MRNLLTVTARNADAEQRRPIDLPLPKSDFLVSEAAVVMDPE
jgi:hypothetical protein